MTDVDPFDPGVPRGRYGRPLIIPTGRGGKPNLKAPLVEYDRASSAADAIDTGGPALTRWQVRHAVLGVAISPDLAALAGALGRDLNTFSDSDKTYLDEIIERAHDRSGGNMKADYGTAIHSITEPGNDGVVPDEMRRDADAYFVTIDEAGIEVDATEVFVVCDELLIAGTFDHIYTFTRDLTVKLNGEEHTIPAGTKVIGDKKTGSLHVDSHAIQLAIYAHGKAYDHNTGERTDLDVDQRFGVVAHIPRLGGKATLHLINIGAGWAGAKLAQQVRQYTLGAKKRLSTAFATYTMPTIEEDVEAPASQDVEAPAPQVVDVDPVKVVDEPAAPAAEANFGDAFANLQHAGLEPTDVILDAINEAPDADTCRALWSQHRTAWQDSHTAAVKARLTQLGRAA